MSSTELCVEAICVVSCWPTTTITHLVTFVWNSGILILQKQETMRASTVYYVAAVEIEQSLFPWPTVLANNNAVGIVLRRNAHQIRLLLI